MGAERCRLADLVRAHRSTRGTCPDRVSGYRSTCPPPAGSCVATCPALRKWTLGTRSAAIPWLGARSRGISHRPDRQRSHSSARRRDGSARKRANDRCECTRPGHDSARLSTGGRQGDSCDLRRDTLFDGRAWCLARRARTMGAHYRHAGSQVRVAPERVRAWFDLWAQLARMPNAASSHLADAEAMIDFEFWAARAESALIAAAHLGDRGGWLAELLPDVRMSRPLGECEAAGYEADARAVAP